MGCPSFVIIGNNLTFSISTHDPDTGISSDADAVPTYRIYEDGTEAAILNGNVDDGAGTNSEFDDANTVGLYVKTVACTAGNGFEDGKSYTVFISATVGTDPGAITYAFTAYTRLPVDVLAISGSTDAADKLEASAETIIVGAAAAGTLSTTEMTTDLTISVNDQLNGRIIIFKEDTTTVALRRQATDITDSVTTNGHLTFTALTTAPVDGDSFIIV